MRHYPKPTSSIDAATGDLVLRVSPVAIAALTERWYAENCGEGEHIRITDFDGLVEAVRKNVHAHDEDWFPGDMSAIESWMGGSGCQAVFEDAVLYEIVPPEEVVAERQVFFGEWAGSQRSNLVDDFDMFRSDLIGVEFLVADYDLSDLGGSAVVVFTRGGKLWKVYGAHIVDGDFRDQWKPVETTAEAMRAELPMVEGAERHEALIVSMHAALDELEGIEPEAGAPAAP